MRLERTISESYSHYITALPYSQKVSDRSWSVILTSRKGMNIGTHKQTNDECICTLLGVSQAAEECLEAPIGDSKNWHILFEAVMLEDRSLK